jgi:hypothetical protein
VAGGDRVRGSGAARGRARRGVAVAAFLVLSSAAACSPIGQSETVEVDPRDEVALALTPSPTQAPAPETTTTVAVATAPPPAPAPTTVAPRVVPTTVAPPAPPATAPASPAPARHTRALQRLSSPDSIRLAAQAMSFVHFDWENRLPGWQLRFLDGRSGYRGLTFPDRKIIEVYVRSSDTPQELAHVVAHELGHAVDVTHLSEIDRATWRAARGFGPATIWFAQGAGSSDFATAAGDFAESFAWIHAPTGHWYGQLSAPPDLGEAAVLAVLSQPG